MGPHQSEQLLCAQFNFHFGCNIQLILLPSPSRHFFVALKLYKPSNQPCFPPTTQNGARPTKESAFSPCYAILVVAQYRENQSHDKIETSEIILLFSRRSARHTHDKELGRKTSPTPRGAASSEEVVLAQLVKNLEAFNEIDGSSQRSQQYSTGQYLKTADYSPHVRTEFL